MLLGCRNADQLEDSLAALEWDLDEDEMDSLTRVSAPGVPDYLQGFLEKNAGMDLWRRLGTGGE